jgi:DNA-directed RNA polymerase subunit K/omega
VIITRFERARRLGARALQISMGAPPLVEVNGGDAIQIAMAEFEKDLLPMTISRLAPAPRVRN